MEVYPICLLPMFLACWTGQLTLCKSTGLTSNEQMNMTNQTHFVGPPLESSGEEVVAMHNHLPNLVDCPGCKWVIFKCQHVIYDCDICCRPDIH